MPGADLSLMLLPQSWDGSQLVANLLLLPNGDPTAPVPLMTGHELPFANAQPVLRAALLPGLRDPGLEFRRHPSHADLHPRPVDLQQRPEPIFAALAAEYTPTVPALEQPRASSASIPEILPGGYWFRSCRPRILHFRRWLRLRHRQPDSQHIASVRAHHRLGRDPLLRTAPAAHCQAMVLATCAFPFRSIPPRPPREARNGQIDTTDLDNGHAKLVTEQSAACGTAPHACPRYDGAGCLRRYSFPDAARLLRRQDHGRRPIRS